MQASGEWDAKRRDQLIRWMWAMVEDRLLSKLRSDPHVIRLAPTLESEIASGKMTPSLAAEKILTTFGL